MFLFFLKIVFTNYHYVKKIKSSSHQEKLLLYLEITKTIYSNIERSGTIETEYFFNLLLKVPIRSNILAQLK